MKDYFNFGGAVFAALLLAASQLGDLCAPQGAKFTQTSMIAVSPGLGTYVEALGDGTVLGAARDQFETLHDALRDAARG